ncbi:helix-turn-helix protein [Marinobacterium sp. xm-v-242]|nr:helix-turn-helix protein [Marinobacterium sp. xm-v-242]NRP76944.1 helix-turn-helix protein [Marinobacterium sp. xm-m-383]
MIRVMLKEALLERSFKDGKSTTMKDVAYGTGIHPVTLSKIAKNNGYNASLETIDKLCDYFNCEVSDLLVYVKRD